MSSGQAVSRRRFLQASILLSGLLSLLVLFPDQALRADPEFEGSDDAGFIAPPPGSGIVRPPIRPPAPPPIRPDPRPFPDPDVDSEIRVPNLVGLCREEAAERLARRGLKSVFSTNHRGSVVRQSPPEGAPLPRRRVVSLTITPVLRRSLQLHVSKDSVQVGEEAHFSAVIQPPWPYGVTTYRLRRNGHVVANTSDGRFRQYQRVPGNFSYSAEAVLRPGPCREPPDIPSVVSPVVNLDVTPTPGFPPRVDPGGAGDGGDAGPQPLNLLIPGAVGLLLLFVLIRLFSRKRPPAESRESHVRGETLQIRLDDGLEAMNSELKQSGDAMDTLLSLEAGTLEMKPGKARIRLVEISDE